MDLVIMAAGLGSRFGGLKQLESIDNDNNFIIDYSIFDAIKAGFNHVIFIIKEDFYDQFKITIGNRIEKYIKVDYVFQNNKNIPSKYNIPQSRQKPFGTGHAILCAKEKITSDFIVINADDFYGRESFLIAYNYLKNNTNTNNYGLIGFKAINTICENGIVKRGICEYENNFLLKIVESTIEKQKNGSLLTTPLIENENIKIIEPNKIVSMNLFAFPIKFLEFLNNYFLDFLEKNKQDLSSCEFFLPSVVTNLIKEKKAQVEIIPTPSKWYGITYKEDLQIVKNAIKNMKDTNLYPNHLWN